MIQTPLQKIQDLSSNCIIALDGTSASGKGTLAKLIAANYSFNHCQSSIFYRKFALDKLNDGSSDLYSNEVTRMSSIIAAIPEVRQLLLKPQRDFLKSHHRVIMEGRDIGTVIAPDADIKIYITADIEVRAQRRFDQMISSSKDADYLNVLSSLKERDERDQERAVAPLIKADDAIEIDTTNMKIEEVLETLLKKIETL